jgi:hypothetical protein
MEHVSPRTVLHCQRLHLPLSNLSLKGSGDFVEPSKFVACDRFLRKSKPRGEESNMPICYYASLRRSHQCSLTTLRGPLSSRSPTNFVRRISGTGRRPQSR